MKLALRFAAASVVVIIVSSSIVIGIQNEEVSGEATQLTLDWLETIAVLQGQRLEAQVEAYDHTFAAVANGTQIRSVLAQHNDNPNSATAAQLHTELDHAIASIGWAKHAQIWASDGTLVANVGHGGTSHAPAEHGATIVPDHEGSYQIQRPLMWQNSTIGVLQIWFDAEPLAATALAWDRLGETGEIVVHHEGLFLFGSRLDPDGGLERHVDTDNGLFSAVGPNNGGLDYRGVPVLSFQVELSNGWNLMIKQDRSEALEPAKAAVKSMQSAVYIAAAFALVAFTIVAHLTARPVAKVADEAWVVAAAHGIAANPASYEVRNLQNAVSAMSDGLLGRAKELDTLVQRRTAALQVSNEDLERFAYVVSHDLQSPLRQVRAALGMVLHQHAERLGDGAELISIADEVAMHMHDQIQGVLDYSRASERAAWDPVDLNALMDLIQQDLAHDLEEAEATLELDQLPTVNGEASALKRVAQNLIENAIKYRAGPLKLRVRGEEDAHGWAISFEDNGMGFEFGSQSQMFQMMNRLPGSPGGGHGIGLAVCRRIVETHGGHIDAESGGPGQGATFTVWLPKAQPEP